MIIKTKNEQETQKFGQKFARSLKGGEIIGLSGELGGGKTTFVKGLAKGLGIKETVTSPTFALIKDYGKLIHIDLYRLLKKTEIGSLGLSDYLGQKDKICVIEWAEKIKDMLEKMPAKVIWLEFEYIDENIRKIKIKTKKEKPKGKYDFSH